MVKQVDYAKFRDVLEGQRIKINNDFTSIYIKFELS